MHLLRLLIRENLQDPEAVERAYFSGSRSDFERLARALLAAYSEAGTDEPPPEVLQDLSKTWGRPIEFIGFGSYRVTFSIGRDLVMKMSLDELGPGPDPDTGVSGDPAGAEMNRDDFRLGTDPQLDHIVPRAYLHAPDWSWVVLERVAPLGSTEQFLSFFRSPLLPPVATLGEAGIERVVEALRIVLEIQAGKQSGTERPDDPLEMYLGYDVPQPEATLEALGSDLLRRSAPFRGLVKLLTRYNVSLDEIISQYGYGVQLQNLGLGSDGRLVLLDSSIFPGR